MKANNYIVLFLVLIILGLGVYIYLYHEGPKPKTVIEQLNNQLNQKDSVIDVYRLDNERLSYEIEKLRRKDSYYYKIQADYDRQLLNIHRYYDRKIAAMDSTTTNAELQQFFTNRYDSAK